MSLKKDSIGKMLKQLQSGIGGANLAANQSISQVVLSAEGLDANARSMGDSGLAELQAVIDTTITTLSAESLVATPTIAQIQAAKKISGLAIDFRGAMQAQQAAMMNSVSGSNVVSAESLGVADISEGLNVSAEAFDGQQASNAIYASIAYNFGAARQDEFGEEIFPTITMDPLQSGYTIETEVTSAMVEFMRSTNGTPDKNKFNKTPIIKAVFDESIFYTDRNKAVPVLRDENKHLFLEAQKFVDKTVGEAVTTAPVKFGQSVGWLGLSQTDYMLARGVADNTDALDRAMKLERVYFTLNGKDNAGDPVTEVFSTPVAMLPFNQFVANPQNHNKDMVLNFSTRSVVLTKDTMTAGSAVSEILSGTAVANHKIYLEMIVNGTANTADGDVAIYGVKVAIAEIRNASNQVLSTTSAEYIAIAAAIGTIELSGYVLEAFRTNSNMRTLGQIITSDSYKLIYNVPFRSGISVLAPTNNAMGSNNDATKLTGMIQAAGIKMNMFAVKTLLNYASMLKEIVTNGTVNEVNLLGIGSFHINPFYFEDTIDLSTAVDSISSAKRLEDVKATISNRIKDAALNMYTNSNYVVAHDILSGDDKVKVIVATDVKTKEYICGTGDSVELGGKLVAKVVATANPLFLGKIALMFGVDSADKNTAPHPLHFGCCLWSPTIVTDIQRSVNGTTIKVCNNIPRFLHVVNVPVMSMLTISDYKTVLGKLAVKFDQI